MTPRLPRHTSGLVPALSLACACALLASCSTPATSLDVGDSGASDGPIDSGQPRTPIDSGAPVDSRGPVDPDTGPSEATCQAAGPTVVRFSTADGLQLEGDLYTTGEVGGAVVLLLHMVPPSNDRTNFPPTFIQALVTRGLSVLNLDRRGAGGSEGNPRDAYLGPQGRLDAQGARDFLAAHVCGFDLGRFGVVGASNGTTTAVDYTADTAQADSTEKEVPRALAFLTGGTYTEAQTSLDELRSIFEPIALLFVFSTEERAWSAPFQKGAPETWVFQEYDPGAHGVGMFQLQPDSIEVVADFLAGALAQP